MAKYECVCIIRTDIGEEQLKSTLDYIRQSLERFGATILSDDHWGVRRLAYEIKKQRDGFYTMFVIEMNRDGSSIAEMRRLFKTNESILRTVFVDVPPIAEKARKLAAERAKKAAEKAAKESEARAAREAAEAEAKMAQEAEEVAAATAAEEAPAEEAPVDSEPAAESAPAAEEPAAEEAPAPEPEPEPAATETEEPAAEAEAEEDK